MAELIPVFIGGAGRSGTTLVVDMLGMHPLISPVYETDFVLRLGSVIFGAKPIPFEQMRGEIVRLMDEWTRPLPLRPHGKREHEKFHHGPHYILFQREFAMQKTAALIDGIHAHQPVEALRGLIVELFADHTRRDGKTRWVNKTPAYVMALPLLKLLFPEMRFIHCVRDGRDTACSAMTRLWGPKSVDEAASWWVANVKQGVEFAQRFPSQCLLVRYEDVLLAPEESLTRMLNWLGESGDAKKMVENYQSEGVRLDQSRIGQWQRQFTDEERRIFRQRAGEMLQLLGYA